MVEDCLYDVRFRNKAIRKRRPFRMRPPLQSATTTTERARKGNRLIQRHSTLRPWLLPGSGSDDSESSLYCLDVRCPKNVGITRNYHWTRDYRDACRALHM